MCTDREDGVAVPSSVILHIGRGATEFVSNESANPRVELKSLLAVIRRRSYHRSQDRSEGKSWVGGNLTNLEHHANEEHWDPFLF